MRPDSVENNFRKPRHVERSVLFRVLKGKIYRVFHRRNGNGSISQDFKDRFREFKGLSGERGRFMMSDKDLAPCPDDATGTTGFDSHYVYHPAWAARVLAKTRPEIHVDIGSTLHFCSMVSAFIPVKFYDYRPANLQLSGLECARADLLALPFDDGSVRSLSCMHTLEHVGLGRYGDPLDPDGDIKAIKELKRVTAKGGDLLIAVPLTGRPRINFNAHRVYSHRQFIGYFPEFELVRFDLIPDRAAETGMIFSATEKDADRQHFGCGCFHFRKRI